MKRVKVSYINSSDFPELEEAKTKLERILDVKFSREGMVVFRERTLSSQMENVSELLQRMGGDDRIIEISKSPSGFDVEFDLENLGIRYYNLILTVNVLKKHILLRFVEED